MYTRGRLTFILRNILRMPYVYNINQGLEFMRDVFLTCCPQIGLAVCMVGRAYGMTVIGMANSPESTELVKRSGAHHIIKHSSKDYAESVLVRQENITNPTQSQT